MSSGDTSSGERRDLSALTTPRGEALMGSLRLPSVPESSAGGATRDEAEGEPASLTDSPVLSTEGPRTPSRRSTKPKSSTSNTGGASQSATSGRKRAVIVYLPGELLDELRAAKRSPAETYTDWVLDAFDEHYDRLEEVYVQLPPRRSPLPPKRRLRRRGINTPTPVQLRFEEDELAPLEERRNQLQVESRSEFITTIIELGLNKKPSVR